MNKPTPKRSLLHFLIWALTAGVGAAFILTASLYLYLSPKLPTVESLKEVKLQTPLRIFSQDLQLIGEFGEKRRTPITFAEIPPLFIKAILAAEDDRYYSHNGVDIKGLLRATVQLVTTGSIQSGGSTITMQVARNFFLNNKQNFTRKFNEILLAFRIEEELTKNEILTLYANKIYLGNRSYGIEAAAQVYYGKSIQQLNLAQLAMIAGLPKAPSAYNPLANPKRALIRRNWILGRMRQLGYIDEALYREAKSQDITASYHGYSVELEADYVAEMARQEAITLFGPAIYSEGYRVYTTLQSTLQRAAVSAVRKGIHAYDWRHGYRGPERSGIAPEQWNRVLAKTATIGALQPAIVSEVAEDSLTILLADGSNGQVLWEDGLKGLRTFVDENRRTAPLKDATERFAVGDLIRVTTKPAAGNEPPGWRLTQLPKAQGALVALDPENGAIKALVGGYSFQQSHFNRITQAERQPGSNFKPFIYTTALENGFTAASIINDAPVVFRDDLLESAWRPENDSGKFYGPTRLRKALYLSRNLISIRLLRSLGISRAVAGIERFGFDPSTLPRDLSLALGSHAVTPLKIATGYAILANGGYRVESHLISRIETVNGEEVYRANPLTVCRECDAEGNRPQQPASLNSPPNSLASQLALEDLSTELGLDASAGPTETLEPPPIAPRVIDERVAYIMDSILKDVIKKGTGKRALSLERSDIAGKTGTTNGPRDAWFSGYSPQLVTTAWLGFDQNLPLGRREYGGSAALPIWIDFMAAALEGQPEIRQPQPQGLVTVRIDPETGKRVAAGVSGGIFEIFRREDLPPLEQEKVLPNGSAGSEALPEEIF